MLEIHLGSAHQYQRCALSLLPVTTGKSVQQLLLRLSTTNDRNAKWLAVHSSRCPLGQIISRTKLLIGYRFIGKGVSGMRIGEKFSKDFARIQLIKEVRLRAKKFRNFTHASTLTLKQKGC